MLTASPAARSRFTATVAPLERAGSAQPQPASASTRPGQTAASSTGSIPATGNGSSTRTT